MANARRTPRIGKPQSRATVEHMAAEVGASPHRLAGVSKLSDGRLKMVGAAHDAKVGMVIPRALADAWGAEASDEGRTKTDLFEDMMLRYLKQHGWKLEG